jgi:hypothetical protein
MLSMLLSLLVLCSCATTPHPPAAIAPSALPAEVAMNRDAGRGNALFVMLRLGSGDEIPFLVDTGAPITFLDKSLESKLAKQPASMSTTWLGGVKRQSDLYLAPRIFLRNTPLLTEWMDRIHTNVVGTIDFKQLSTSLGHPLLGILGMDCLGHYCVQLDFVAGKLRFLEPASLDAAKLGKAFSLTYSNDGCPQIHYAGLLGSKRSDLLIDTGYYVGDGALHVQELEKARKQKARGKSDSVDFLGFAETCFPKCVWQGQTYTNLLIGDGGNLIGLRFLARHLVTLDFPHDKMYLKKTTGEPLPDDRYRTLEATAEFLKSLMAKGQLPGWSGGDFKIRYVPNSEIFEVSKEGDPSIYDYAVSSGSKNGPLRLQKAWRTDQSGQIVEHYAVP